MRYVLPYILHIPLRVLRSGGAVFGGFLVLYFALFAFEGDRSLSTLKNINLQVAEAKAELADVQAQRQEVENRVIAMRPSGIDPDLLDEAARRQLGYSEPGELVILQR